MLQSGPIRRTFFLALLLIAAFATPAARARDWPLDDPVVEEVRERVDARDYQSVLEVVSPLIELARSAGDSLQLGRLICARGQAELGIGEVSQSLLSLARARRLAEAQNDTLTIMTTLGVGSLALNQQGRFEEAIESSTRHIDLSRAARDPRAQAFGHLSIGYAELQRARLSESRRAYEEAVRGFEEAGLTRWQLTALTGLGRVATDEGDVAVARQTYRHVQSLAHSIDDLRNEADATNNLGVLEYHHGDVAIAAAHFERAHEMLMRLGDPVRSIRVLTNVALMRSFLGELDAASRILEEAAALAREKGASAAYYSTLSDLASLRIMQGRSNAASRLLREVIANSTAMETRLDASLTLAANLASVDSAEAALGLLRQSREQLGDAKSLNRMSIDIVESRVLLDLDRPEEVVRILVPLSDQTKHRLRPVILANLSMALSRIGEGKAARERARQAVESLEKRRESTQSRSWREVVSAVPHKAVVEAVVMCARAKPGEDATTEEDFNLLQRVKARTLIERLSSPSAKRGPSIEPVTLRELQATGLRPGELLLDFHVGRQSSLVFAVTKDAARCIVLSVSTHDLKRDVSLFREAVRHLDARQSSERVIAKTADRIATVILGPIRDLLASSRRVIYCPDEALFALPIGLLPANPSSGVPMLTEFELVYIPAASMMTALDRAREIDGSIATLTTKGDGLSGATEEVAFLARRFTDVRVLDGTAEGLLDSLRGYAVIHVAAHTDPDDVRPWYSGIRLREAEDPASGDATESLATHLRASDLLGKPLGANLAVLATCESGLGRITSGQGVMGLSTAFLTADVAAVVSTLWKINDEVTRDLMQTFYESLAAGSTVSAAVQRAQLAIRSRRDTAHPYYWAGFVVTGDGDLRVPLQKKSSFGLVTLVATAGLAVLVLVGLITRRRSIPPTV